MHEPDASKDARTPARCPVNIQRRFLLLIPLFVVLLLASRAYIGAVGGSITSNVSLPSVTEQTLSSLVVDVEDPSVVDVSLHEAADGSVDVTFVAKGEGETSVLLSSDASNTTSDMYWFVQVDKWGTVFLNGIDFNGFVSIQVAIVVFLAVALILLVSAFVQLMRHSWFSYAMIATGGLALFTAMAEVMFVWGLVPGNTESFLDLANDITSIVERITSVTVPLMTLLALGLVVSNVSLVRHEGMRPQNLLGIGFGVVWAAATIAFFAVGTRDFSGSFDEYRAMRIALGVLSVTVLYVETLLISTTICAWLAVRHVPAGPARFAVVLGCGLRPDGTCTPLLAGRVEAALAWDEQQRKLGRDSDVFVTSGGQGPGEVCSESSAMKAYLVDRGVEEAHVIEEDRSTSTHENMLFSIAKIEETTGSRSAEQDGIVFSTTNYHVFRGYICAHDAGFAAEGIASYTKAYFWPNALLREFVGLLYRERFALLATYLAVCALYAAVQVVLTH